MPAAASAIGTTLLQVDLTSVFCSGDIFLLFSFCDLLITHPDLGRLTPRLGSGRGSFSRLCPGSLDPHTPFATADHAANLEFVFAEEALDPVLLGLAMLGVTAPFA